MNHLASSGILGNFPPRKYHLFSSLLEIISGSPIWIPSVSNIESELLIACIFLAFFRKWRIQIMNKILHTIIQYHVNDFNIISKLTTKRGINAPRNRITTRYGCSIMREDVASNNCFFSYFNTYFSSVIALNIGLMISRNFLFTS